MKPERPQQQRDIDWSEVLAHALHTPGSLGTAYSRFYSYSMLNCVLLRMQGAEGPVATYERWRKVGRQVLRGSKAMEILRPITVTKQPEQEGEEPKKITRFKMVKAVFDYKQTTGEELPPAEVPEWSLERALGKLAITRVPFTQLDGNIAGYSYDRNIAINPVAPFPLKTTFHECAHIVNGHTTPENIGQYAAHRGLWEFEAEGAAYLVANELEVQSEQEASVSRAYIANWLRGETPPDASIRKVFTTADAIVRAGRPEVTAETEAAA